MVSVFAIPICGFRLVQPRARCRVLPVGLRFALLTFSRAVRAIGSCLKHEAELLSFGLLPRLMLLLCLVVDFRCVVAFLLPCLAVRA